MNICDVCNAVVSPGQGSRVTAAEFRKLMDKGFGMNETNIEMLTKNGIPREAAIGILKKQYASYQSDWLLCPKCTEAAPKA